MPRYNERMSVLNLEDVDKRFAVKRGAELNGVGESAGVMERKRPESVSNRFTDSSSFVKVDAMTILDKRHDPFEWLSMSWRNYRSEHMAKSRAAAVIKMIDRDYQFFPSIKEILLGLIEAQQRNLASMSIDHKENKTQMQRAGE